MQVFKNFWQTLNEYLKNGSVENLEDIAFAIFLIIFGWALSIVLKFIVIKLGDRIRLNQIIEKKGFSSILKKARIKSLPTELIGNFIQAWIITLFLMLIASFLKLKPVSDFFSYITGDLLPDIAIALLIVLLAVRFGDFVGNFIAGALSLANSHAYRVVSVTARSILIAIGILAALSQLKIAPTLINTVFIGFVSMVSLAGGLAFGLGSKDLIRDMLSDLRNVKNLKKEKKKKKIS